MARPGLRNHPKFLRALHLLGSKITPPHLLGLLEFLWSVSYESGEPIIGDQTDVELSAGWLGKKGELCAALLNAGGNGRAGFIDKLEDGRYRIHDLFDHAPDYVQGRAAREAERTKEKACSHCGATYHSPDCRAIYCSDRCKQGAYRDRNKPTTLPTVTDTSVTVTDRDGALPSVTDRYRSPAPAPAPAPALKKEGAAKAAACPLFEEFWKAWPAHERKDNRKACLKHWTANNLAAEAPAILAALAAWKKSASWLKEGGSFIPAPLPWLNKEKWKSLPSINANGHPAQIAVGDRPIKFEV